MSQRSRRAKGTYNRPSRLSGSRSKSSKPSRPSRRDRYLRAKYGISESVYDEILRSQGYRCAICGAPPKPGRRLHVDHDHRSGRVRGALCWFCNHRVLGRRRENPAIHLAAARYLSSSKDWRDRCRGR